MDMQEIDLEEFLPTIIPYVRGVPDNVALEAVRQSVEEFCRRSLIVRKVMDGVDVVADEPDYFLDIPYYYYSVALLEISLGSLPLAHLDTETLANYFGPNWRTLTGPVSYVTQDDTKSFRLVKIPTRTYTDPVRMTVALAPNKLATSVRRIVFDQWSETIAHGARARLHDTPDQPYFNPEAALRFRSWFDSGCSEAKIRADKGFGKNSDLRVRPRFV